MIADVVSESRVGHRFAGAPRQPARVELRRAETSRHDAEHVHVLSFQSLPRVQERVGAFDARLARQHTRDRRR